MRYAVAVEPPHSLNSGVFTRPMRYSTPFVSCQESPSPPDAMTSRGPSADAGADPRTRGAGAAETVFGGSALAEAAAGDGTTSGVCPTRLSEALLIVWVAAERDAGAAGASAPPAP